MIGEAWQHVNRVSFELSNQCPNAQFHKSCPANRCYTTPVILETEVLKTTLETLGRMGFAGEVFLSVYNEPMADPRLWYFLGLISQLCPKSRTSFYTSGWMLTDQMLRELGQYGVQNLHVMAYTQKEFERLSALTPSNMIYEVRCRQVLDSRLSIYDPHPEVRREFCGAPLRDVIVWCNGLVGSCCLDWRHTVGYGNLNTTSLDKLFRDSAMLADYHKRMQGTLLYPFCNRCTLWKAA